MTNPVLDALHADQAKIIHQLIFYAIVVGVISGVIGIFRQLAWEKKREQRKKYYREDYLQSGDWKRKRYVVLKRDGWKCVYCGRRATQVHHKQYAHVNIGKEPIEWLVSVCKKCHEKQHER